MNRSGTSPFRTPAPGRAGQSDSYESLIRNLERENERLVEEITTLKARGRGFVEVEDKLERVIRHNSEILAENEKLAKLINQKKAEVEQWKAKYEGLAANRTASSDLENRKLLQEIYRIKEEQVESEHRKTLQLSELKNQHHQEIQNLRRQGLGANEKYELEIRRLKEHCERKEYELNDINIKLGRLAKETDFYIGKLREERERLKYDLLFYESYHRKELDGLRNKLEINFHNELDSTRKQHLSQIEALDYENAKLKEVVHSKNLELEQLLAKQLKVKSNHEETVTLLKCETEDLKTKLIETEHIAEMELAALKQKLIGMKEAEMGLLKSSHASQLELLHKDLDQLNGFLTFKSQYLEVLSREKAQVRAYLEAVCRRLEVELEAARTENVRLSAEHTQAGDDFYFRLRNGEERLNTVERRLQKYIETLSNELKANEAALLLKSGELERTRNQSLLLKRKLEGELAEVSRKAQDTADKLNSIANQSSYEIEDQKRTFSIKINQLQNRIDGLEEEGRAKDGVIDSLKITISSQETEIRTTEEGIAYSKRGESELRRILQENTAKWQSKEREYISLLSAQLESLDKAKKKEIEELNLLHEHKITSLRQQIKELYRQIAEKNASLGDLKSQYAELVARFEEVFGQRASQKSLDIKIPGWLPDTLATKSLFDVFLKNKVLDYCV